MDRNERIARRIALVPAVCAGALPVLVYLLGADPFERNWLDFTAVLIGLWLLCAIGIAIVFRRRAIRILGMSAPIALFWPAMLIQVFLAFFMGCALLGGCIGMVS